MLSSMDVWGTFLFFAMCCLIALVYCFIMVPETAGRALENIDNLFQHPWYLMRKFAYEKDSDEEGKSIPS